MRVDTTPRAPALTASRLSLRYGKRVVLTDVEFAVMPGESVAIMGVSGSGKTSLLGCLSGLLLSASGVVAFDGHQITSLRDRDRAALRLSRMGFVFQFGELVEELTLSENVMLPLLLLGRRHGAKQRALALLDTVGVRHLADSLPSNVSGGEAQRAAVARALSVEPLVVFADEPTGSLDDASADAVLDLLLGRVTASGSALVLVTHSHRVAERCHRRYVIEGGTLVEHVRPF